MKIREAWKPYNSTEDTRKHIWRVFDLIEQIRLKLTSRAFEHDKSKLASPEKEAFDEFTPILSATTYGSQEYRETLDKMRPAIEHHHQNNPHHPEYRTEGIAGMSLLDLVEMLCDWKAASERHADGDIRKSLEINRERHQISDQLYRILENTCREMGWI